ncbi:MAG: oligosaccharide flippase family protein [candidate division KSB1 bacterium]|nr:oligosaccharide flippase family protein [candidate division KSB1 bacterium]MDZ7318186.1 oligosaccharide flippase family protein [candidate division KSB1 bacterium]MDZ7340585.1 oligosaccharide flippase family protein [candidate division KSB1 bacterium]
MFKSILRLTKQSAIYGIGHVLSKAVVILLLPIHTNYVIPLEYGIATQLLVFLAVMAVVYSYGLNTALLQFFILAKNPIEKKQYFSTAFIVTAITSVLFSIPLYVARNVFSQWLFDSPQYSYLITLSIGILIFDALVLLSKNILRAEERAAGFIFYSLLNICINVLFNYIFVQRQGLGVKGIFWANLLASGLTWLALLPLTARHFLPKLSRAKLQQMMKFGLPFLPSTLAILVIDSSDRIFIKKFLGLEAVGIYGAGYKLSLVIKLVINAFQFAWIPFFISIARDKNAPEIFAKILTYFVMVCSLVFLFFSMFMDQIVRLRLFGLTIVGQEYWGGTVIVPVVILAYIAYGIYLNFLVGIYLHEKTRYLIYITGFAAGVNLAANYFLIPLLKLMGAAYATLLAYGSMAALLYWLAQKFYPINYEWRKILKVTLLSGVVFIAYKILSQPSAIILNLGLLVSYLIMLVMTGFFDARELQKLQEIGKRYYDRARAHN